MRATLDYYQNWIAFKVKKIKISLFSLVKTKYFCFKCFTQTATWNFLKIYQIHFLIKQTINFSVLFTTIQSATNNDFKSVCKWAHLFLKEIFQIINW
jgi:hypothetical protein